MPNAENPENTLIGATILVGLEYQTRAGEFLSRAQIVGRIAEVDEVKGVRIESEPPLWLPPDFAAIQGALPGEYRLRGDGRVVINPEFLAFYKILGHGEAQPTWEPLFGGQPGHWVAVSAWTINQDSEAATQPCWEMSEE